jgi:hypothetical protein
MREPWTEREVEFSRFDRHLQASLLSLIPGLVMHELRATSAVRAATLALARTPRVASQLNPKDLQIHSIANRIVSRAD